MNTGPPPGSCPGRRDYYARKLSGERLRACYDIAPPRARAYLDAEVAFLAESAPPDESLLELGCGYGRVVRELAGEGRRLFGIDTSAESLVAARSYLAPHACHLARMDAARLGFAPGSFDIVICVQNGISAFHRDPAKLIGEAIRVTRPGGKVLFSSYARSFWPARIEWFRAQAEAGLIGKIDEESTGDGVIVCRDGFRSGTVGRDAFRALTTALPVRTEIVEVDRSSLFCVMTVS